MDRQWQDLLPDLLQEIAGHLRHIADFARFHAVCKAWRSSRNPATLSRAQSLLPWLLAPSMNSDDSLHLRCVFTKTSYRVPRSSSDTWSNCVCGADGASFHYFTAVPCPMLRDPLVDRGVPIALHAPFPRLNGRWPDSPGGIRYNDGTIFLYKMYHPIGNIAEFKAAILPPGDNSTWMVVERTFQALDVPEFSVAYHSGKVLVTLEGFLWHVLKPDTVSEREDGGDMVIQRPCMPCNDNECYIEYSYTLESRGELLWVTVTINKDYPIWCRMVRALYVSVYALEEAPTTEKMRWVKKDGRSLADRMLFLGNPNSFTLDASRQDIDGGFAYFICDNYHEGFRRQRICVIRYNLLNNKADIIEWLPETCRSEICTWLVIQPTISPIQDICERLPQASKWKQVQNMDQLTPKSIIQIATPYQQH